MMSAFTNEFGMLYPDSPLCQVPATPVLTRQPYTSDSGSPAFAVVPSWTPETTQDIHYPGIVPGTPGTPLRTPLGLPSPCHQLIARRGYSEYQNSPAIVPTRPEIGPYASSPHVTPLSTTPLSTLKKPVLKKRLLVSSRKNRNLVPLEPSTPLCNFLASDMNKDADDNKANVAGVHINNVQANDGIKSVASTFETTQENDTEHEEETSSDANREVTTLQRSSETHVAAHEVIESADLLDLI